MNLNKNLIYVTRDIERALGQNAGMYGDFAYVIVTNSTEYSESVRSKHPQFVVTFKDTSENKGDSGLVDTIDLLKKIEEGEIILPKGVSIDNSDFLVFKNTSAIDEWAKKNNASLLNPDSALAEKIENKITQSEWLSEDRDLLPQHYIKKMADVHFDIFNGEPFVVQWAHSHTGDGTMVIKKEADLEKIKEKFPLREARITQFINGPVFTQNIAVGKDAILIGNLSYQITGLLPFTENEWSTVGNDWSYPYSAFSEKEIEDIRTIALKTGDCMQKSGWKGLFGIDIIFDSERNVIKLLEINARQPASTAYESTLQILNRVNGIEGYTTFEGHLITLLNQKIEKDSLILINDGAQIVQRVNSTTPIAEEKLQKLESMGYFVVGYENKKPNSDHARIQSVKGIIESHNKLNKRGQEIKDILL